MQYSNQILGPCGYCPLWPPGPRSGCLSLRYSVSLKHGFQWAPGLSNPGTNKKLREIRYCPSHLRKFFIWWYFEFPASYCADRLCQEAATIQYPRWSGSGRASGALCFGRFHGIHLHQHSLWEIPARVFCLGLTATLADSLTINLLVEAFGGPASSPVFWMTQKNIQDQG